MGLYHPTLFVVLLAAMVNSQDLWDADVLLSTAPPECEKGYSCVKFFLCSEEGYILKNGSGLLTPRQEENNGRSCEGDPFKKCCRIPEEPVNIEQRQNIQECKDGYTCVKYYLCANENGILTNGSGLLHPREDGPAGCNGDRFSMCCRNPEPAKPTKRIGCSLNHFCVPYYLCDDVDGIVKDGRRLLDPRSDDSPCETEFDVCCSHEPKNKPTETPKSPNKGCGWRNKDGLYFEFAQSNFNQTKFTEFPWTMALMNETEILGQVKDVYKCGGSLIHPSVVLTAAHCLTGISAGLKVRAGEWDIQTYREPLSQQDLKVSEIIIHERYDQGTLQNDIAILILNGMFDLKDNVQPICLPPKDTIFNGQKCYVTGWGKSEFSAASPYQVIMKKLELPIIPRTKCQSSFRDTRLGPFFELHSSMMCAGGEDQTGTCLGDGGAPLVCPIPGSEERYYQAGIVSWGLECGEKEIPEVFVALSEMRPWIEEKLRARKIDFSYFTP